MTYPTVRKTALVDVFLACLAILLLTHCGATNTTASSPTFTSVYTNTLSPECARCHVTGGSGTQAGASLDFSTQSSAYSTLLASKVTATDVIATCGSVSIVTPGNAATSYIAATEISAYYSTNFVVAGCTPFSHINTGTGVALSATDITNLTGWINGGALNN